MQHLHIAYLLIVVVPIGGEDHPVNVQRGHDHCTALFHYGLDTRCERTSGTLVLLFPYKLPTAAFRGDHLDVPEMAHHVYLGILGQVLLHKGVLRLGTQNPLYQLPPQVVIEFVAALRVTTLTVEARFEVPHQMLGLLQIHNLLLLALHLDKLLQRNVIIVLIWFVQPEQWLILHVENLHRGDFLLLLIHASETEAQRLLLLTLEEVVLVASLIREHHHVLFVVGNQKLVHWGGWLYKACTGGHWVKLKGSVVQLLEGVHCGGRRGHVIRCLFFERLRLLLDGMDDCSLSEGLVARTRGGTGYWLGRGGLALLGGGPLGLL